MNLRLIAIPVVSALIGAALGYGAARWVAPWLGWLLAAAGLAAAVGVALAGQGRPGMDGLGMVVAALLILAPAGLGAALGTVGAALQAARRSTGD